MVEERYCVYRHTCPNGKVYIGITKQSPKARWKNGQGYKQNKYFYNAIMKYGWENILHEILYTGLTATEAEEKEIELIAEYRSAEKACGYNIATGGLTTTISEEGRKRISRSMIEQYANGQRPRMRSEEIKRKTSETLKKQFANGELVRTISEEQKQKIKKAHKGKTLSETHKEKIRKSSHCKAVMQCDGDIIVNVYDSVREAGRQIGVDYTGILKVLAGKKKTAGGYTWKYVV